MREPEKMEKNKNKKGHQRYISCMCGGTPAGNMMKFSIVVEPLNIMNHVSFHLNLMASVRATGGSKRGFAFEMHLALNNIASRYRAGK
jgi:hypothetical protein